MLSRLSEATDDQNSADVKNVVEAAVWDQELEDASIRAIERLNAELGYDVLSLPKLGLLGGFGGGTPKVVQQMTTIFARKYRTEKS